MASRPARRENSRITAECWNAQSAIFPDGPHAMRASLGDSLESCVFQKRFAGFLDVDLGWQLAQGPKFKPARLEMGVHLDKLLLVRSAEEKFFSFSE